MRSRYAVYLAAPIALAALAALQWGVSLARVPRPRVHFAFGGEDRERRVLEAAARAGDEAVLRPRPLERAFEGAGLVVWDQALRPREGALSGGPACAELERLKDLAFAGSDVVLGYRAFAETESEELAADLAETAGVATTGWVGAYIPRLEAEGAVPGPLRRAWEAANGEAWAFRGGGLVMRNQRDGTALVLRRGRELGAGAVRARSRAGAGDLSADGYFSGWFCVLSPGPLSSVLADIVVDLAEEGRALFSENGLPSSFPALLSRAYGSGRAIAMAGDFAGRSAVTESAGPLPLPRLERSRTLDSPENGIAQYQRLLVPLLSGILALSPRTDAEGGTASSSGAGGRSAIEVRVGPRYLERRAKGGSWEPWFVQGVDLGASVPGRWATEPSTDDGYYLETFAGIAGAGFDSIRVYTLLPPAFYRALARFNESGGGPLYLFQGIWLDEEPPGGNLLDPEWLAGELEESDRCVDALFGAASVEPRRGKSWGEYRSDASPWLAAFLVGRELLPEEVEATGRSRPGYRWDGGLYSCEEGHPVESFLAALADRAASRTAERGGAARPVGIVSWPTLDPLRHPGAWAAARPGEPRAAPYDDRASVDLRAIAPAEAEGPGFFAAFHIYPNFPDFLIRETRYESRDPSGAGRYGAYLDDLRSVLPTVPLIVAEFGLATGFGTAHLHPEGLDHGGLTEERQASGLVRLFREIARRGAGGGFVFEWSDEWSKKAWTTEPYMIPYDRHALWHNAIDPEQNYGVLAWKPSSPRGWADSGEGVRTAVDEEFLSIEIELPPGPSEGTLEVGIDTVPGRSGQYRLVPGGPIGPQGSEFKVVVRLREGGAISARLLVSADYDRDAGPLFPRESKDAHFSAISTLVNAATRTEEGVFFPALREDGSAMRPDSPTERGLVAPLPGGGVLLRLPWSRLNVSDPSSGAVLLDERDARRAPTRDGIATARVDSIGVWASFSSAPGRAGADAASAPETVYLPAVDRSFRAPLRGWDSVRAEPRPKAAVSALAGLLKTWEPLALAEPAE